MPKQQLQTRKPSRKFSEQRIPEARALQKCSEVEGNNVLATKYTLQRFKERTSHVAQEKDVQAIYAIMEEKIDIAEARVPNSELAWRGIEDTRDNGEIERERKVEKAIETISEQPHTIIMDFAVNDAAQFLRGFLVDGKSLPPDDPMVKHLDNLFHAWIVDNHLLIEGSIVYECETERNEEGKQVNVLDKNQKVKVAFDENGKPIRANAARVIQLLTDAHHPTGLGKFIESKGLAMTTRQNKYPQPPAPEPTAEQAAVEPVAQSPEPDNPAAPSA